LLNKVPSDVPFWYRLTASKSLGCQQKCEEVLGTERSHNKTSVRDKIIEVRIIGDDPCCVSRDGCIHELVVIGIPSYCMPAERWIDENDGTGMHTQEGQEGWPGLSPPRSLRTSSSSRRISFETTSTNASASNASMMGRSRLLVGIALSSVVVSSTTRSRPGGSSAIRMALSETVYRLFDLPRLEPAALPSLVHHVC
jgi:hypothetical protein